MTVPTALSPLQPAVSGPGVRPPEREALRAVAQDLEAAFLAEMLKHAGLGAARAGAFGGGAGEDQFASLLRMEQARAMAERGGVGLAESIFGSLVARADAQTASPDGQGR